MAQTQVRSQRQEHAKTDEMSAGDKAARQRLLDALDDLDEELEVADVSNSVAMASTLAELWPCGCH